MDMKEKEKGLRRIGSTLAMIYNHSRNIHWNIEGVEFFELHFETEKVYEKTEEFIDRISEKLVQMKLLPPASFSEFLANSDLKEIPSKKWRTGAACQQLVADIEVLFKEVRELDGKVDVFIQPLLDDIITYYDKYHWQFSALTR